MRKIVLLTAVGVLLLICCVFIIKSSVAKPISESSEVVQETEEDEASEAESLEDRYKQQFDQMRDPATNTIPTERLVDAINFTKASKFGARTTSVNYLWSERGPIYDSVGPSNGNGRGGGTGVTGGYTAGIIQCFYLDTIGDPTGNTIFIGSPSGGLWKCTNLMSGSAPNWQPVNDVMSNLAIASITRDPAHANTLYLATGDANTRDVLGYGVWKSTDNGVTWNVLPSSTGYRTSFKIICDNAGNVYLASGGYGLLRSNDGGTTWTYISPSGLTATNPGYVTDLEISSTGRLHAAFGYYGTSAGNTCKHYYTDNPATVTSASGWNASTGIRVNTTVACSRIELATQGNTLYAVTGNASMNVDSCYKSVDGGATWTKQNSTLYTSGLGSSQVWYAVTLQINPDDDTQFIVGGLDAYKSVNSGATITRQTYWVTSTPYVHADHHCMLWYKNGTESRVLIGCDGGMFYSTDGGVNWTNRNLNLGIKQFYSCSIHPTNTDVIFAGSQDNGCHQIRTPGKTYSIETTGGDGAFVHINQANPSIQFGSYVYNQYRRSTNGGTSWSSVNLSSSLGFFINPFDYDDAQNNLYASNANYAGNNTLRRWLTANTSSTSTTITFSELTRSGTGGDISAVKVSPYTTNRIFIGANNGKLLRVENANTVTTATETANTTDITGASFPTGYINCINTGLTDDYLVAVFSNYGVNNIWYSTDAGVSWTAIDGNLPDMPIWWATFAPGSNTRMIIGTETGVFTTENINGASTSWTAHTDFPMVRTNMIKIRASDRVVVAATYGRGLWQATVPFPLPVTLTSFSGQLDNNTSKLSWHTSFEQNTERFEIEKSTNGTDFYRIGSVNAAGNSTVSKDYGFTDRQLSPANFYRLKMIDGDGQYKYSNVVLIKYNVTKQNVWVGTNPLSNFIDLRFAVESSSARVQLLSMSGAVLADQTFKNINGQVRMDIKGNISAGSYIVRTITGDGQVFNSKVIKQ